MTDSAQWMIAGAIVLLALSYLGICARRRAKTSKSAGCSKCASNADHALQIELKPHLKKEK